MNPNTRRLLFAGVVAYLVFMLVVIPARQLIYWFTPDTSPLRSAAWNGTLWSGHVDGLRFGPTAFRRLDWQFRPLMLLLGQASFATDIRDPDIQGSINFGLGLSGRLHIGNGHLEFSANRLDPLVSVMPVAFAGRLLADIEDGEIGAGVRWVEGVMHWQAAGLTAQNVVVPLGDLRLETAESEGGMSGQLRDESPEGPFAVDAQVRLGADGAWSLNGDLQPRTTMPGEVGAVLDFLGEPTTGGGYRINLNGKP